MNHLKYMRQWTRASDAPVALILLQLLRPGWFGACVGKRTYRPNPPTGSQPRRSPAWPCSSLLSGEIVDWHTCAWLVLDLGEVCMGAASNVHITIITALSLANVVLQT